jgi:hypothetical protein
MQVIRKRHGKDIYAPNSIYHTGKYFLNQASVYKSVRKCIFSYKVVTILVSKICLDGNLAMHFNSKNEISFHPIIVCSRICAKERTKQV